MRIGFIGLGFQGKPLARNIVDAGFALIVYDLREGPMRELEEAGATAASSLAEVAAASDLVIICVVDDAQVMSVLDGPDGIFSAAHPGCIVAIHSTILPETVRQAADSAELYGLTLIDAPVSGSAKGAEEKTMSYMVGGPREAIEACLPVFRASGPTVTITGDVGTATAAKIAHQVVCCITMMAVHEGLKLGEAAGVSRDALLAVFHGGFAQSRAADMWAELDLHPRATPIFYKDLRAAVTLAHDLDVPLPASALVQQMLPEILPRQKKDK